MISAQKIMHDFTGASELAQKRSQTVTGASESPTEDATRKQLKINWLQSTVTQSVLKELGKESKDLVDSAIALAVAYPTSQNHLQIVQNLVRVNQINNIINKYAKPE